MARASFWRNNEDAVEGGEDDMEEEVDEDDEVDSEILPSADWENLEDEEEACRFRLPLWLDLSASGSGGVKSKKWNKK